MKTAPAIALVIALLHAAPAAAQPAAWTDNGYVTIGGFYQPAAGFSDLVRPIQFGEAGQIDTRYGSGALPGFDASAGVRVWRRLAVGVDIGISSKSGSASVSAQVPHPLYFDRQRPVAGDAGGFTRSEKAVNVEALVMLPIHGRWQAAVFGGPTWFMVDQDLVTAVTVTDSYPFDTAAFAGTATVRRSKSKAGFNVGGDLTWLLRPRVGVGIDVRFSRAEIPLTDTATIVAGGAHVGGGMRFRF
jgi:hypothetical protein